MKKVRKLVLILLIVIIGISSILITFVSPNNYKPKIIMILEEQFGHKIRIDGMISWSLAPYIAFSVENMSILDEEGVAALSADTVYLTTKLSDILQKKILITGIEISGLNIYKPISFNLNKEESKNEKFSIRKFSIRKSSYTHIDRDGLEYKFKNIDLDIDNLNYIHDLEYAHGKMKFTFENNKIKEKIRFNSPFLLTKDKKEIIFNNINLNHKNINLDGKARIDIRTKLDVTGRLSSSLNKDDFKLLFHNQSFLERYDFNNMSINSIFRYTNNELSADILNLNIDECNIQGNLKVNLSNPTAKFELKINNADFTRINSQEPLKEKPVPKIPLLEGKFEFTKAKIMKNLIYDKITGKMIYHNQQLESRDIHLKKKLENDKISVFIDLRPNNPILTTNGTISHIDLTKELNFEKLSGLLSLNFKTTSEFGNIENLLSDLSGDIKLSIKDGAIVGHNFVHIMESANKSIISLQGLLKQDSSQSIDNILSKNFNQWNFQGKNEDSTKFDMLNFKGMFKNGTSQDSQLNIDDKEYKIVGDGNINLRNQNISYNLSASLYNKSNYIPLHIKISGPIKNPKISPDVQNYISDQLKNTQRDLIKKTTKKVLEENILNLIDGFLE